MNNGIMLLQFLQDKAKPLNDSQVQSNINNGIANQSQPDIKGTIKNLKVALEHDDEDSPFTGVALSKCEKKALTVTCKPPGLFNHHLFSF